MCILSELLFHSTPSLAPTLQRSVNAAQSLCLYDRICLFLKFKLTGRRCSDVLATIPAHRFCAPDQEILTTLSRCFVSRFKPGHTWISFLTTMSTLRTSGYQRLIYPLYDWILAQEASHSLLVSTTQKSQCWELEYHWDSTIVRQFLV